MNPESLIAMLEPLRAPDPLAWWPPAPGWWLIAIGTLLLLAMAVRALLRLRDRGAALREARRSLEEIAAASMTDRQRAGALTQLQRRVAIAIAGRAACAGLTGQRWTDFLNGLSRSSENSFDAVLAELPYQCEVPGADVDILIESTRSWLQSLEPAR